MENVEIKSDARYKIFLFNTEISMYTACLKYHVILFHIVDRTKKLCILLRI